MCCIRPAGAYAVCLRVYNGDVADDVEGCAALLITLSAAFAAAAAPRPAASAQQGKAGEAPARGGAAAAPLPGTATAALEGVRQKTMLPSALVRRVARLPPFSQPDPPRICPITLNAPISRPSHSITLF